METLTVLGNMGWQAGAPTHSQLWSLLVCVYTKVQGSRIPPGQPLHTQTQLQTPSCQIRDHSPVFLIFPSHLSSSPLKYTEEKPSVLCSIVIGTSHSFIKKMFIRSLLWSKDTGYVKVSSLELKALYVWPYWAQGRIQGVLNKYLPLIVLMFLSLTLRKMIIISQMIMKKEACPYYKGWMHTTCPALGSPHDYSPISFLALPCPLLSTRDTVTQQDFAEKQLSV